MTAELLMAVAMLCQVHGSDSSAQVAARQASCQKAFLQCMLTKLEFSAINALGQCVVEKKLN